MKKLIPFILGAILVYQPPEGPKVYVGPPVFDGSEWVVLQADPTEMAGCRWKHKDSNPAMSLNAAFRIAEESLARESTHPMKLWKLDSIAIHRVPASPKDVWCYIVTFELEESGAAVYFIRGVTLSGELIRPIRSEGGGWSAALGPASPKEENKGVTNQ